MDGFEGRGLAGAFGPELFVHGAMLCHLPGPVLREEVPLRPFLPAGTGLYVLHYAFVAEAPLREAIHASVAIAAANPIGLARVVPDPMEWLVRRRDRAVFDRMDELALGAMPPGQFRAPMRIARRRMAAADVVATAPDHPPPEPIPVMPGTARVEWVADVEVRRHPCLIGEVGLMRGTPGMGRVVVEAGTDDVAWPMGGRGGSWRGGRTWSGRCAP